MILWMAMSCLLVQPAPDGGSRSGPWRQVAVTEGRVCGLNTAWKIACTTPQGSFVLWNRLDTDYALLEGGYAGICALTKAGEIECFDTVGDLVEPPTRAGFETLNVGHDAACARHSDGAFRCWGDEQGAVNDLSLPNEPVEKISIGLDFGVMLLETGEVSTWGLLPANWQEDLNKVDGEIVDVEAGLGGFIVTTESSARQIYYTTTTWDFGGELQGAAHTHCARDADKSVLCLSTDGPSLTTPDLPLRDFDAAEDFACGVTEARRIRCWGDAAQFPFE